MKVVAIIQARMNSTRLPGKILYKVLDQSLLALQIERLRRVPLIDEIVIATTINAIDDPIVALSQQLGIAYYRGPELDVLKRYYEAAVEFKANAIVRLTSDCPLIDPFTVDRVIAHYLFHLPSFDYVSNILLRTYPRGMDTEIFTMESLRIAHHEAVSLHEREHVTPFLYTNPKRFRLGSVEYISNESHHRWTVDTLEDFQLIALIFESLYPANPSFSLEDTLELLQKHPDWLAINSFIQQKQ